MKVLGVDPGFSGFLSVVVINNGMVSLVSSDPMPLTKDGHIDFRKLREIIKKSKADYCLVEHQHAFPKQGVVSTGKLMYAYGAVVGVISAFYNRFQWEAVSAKKWQIVLKKEEDLTITEKNRLEKLAGKKTKKISIITAESIFKRKFTNHNKTDSMLIAYYGGKHYFKED